MSSVAGTGRHMHSIIVTTKSGDKPNLNFKQIAFLKPSLVDSSGGRPELAVYCVAQSSLSTSGAD